MLVRTAYMLPARKPKRNLEIWKRIRKRRSHFEVHFAISSFEFQMQVVPFSNSLVPPLIITARMQCPRCQFESEAQTLECIRCGIVFAKYVRSQAILETPPIPLAEEVSAAPQEAGQELLYRALALPAALIAARIVVNVAPGVRLLTMWVHECGHAVTAWLSGFGAMPGPWLTSVDSERSFILTGAVAFGLGFGGFEAWKTRRWGLLFGAVVALLLQVALRRLYSDQAQAWIIFGGDAGCFVLGSLLMLTFYARRESALVQNELRWGLLVIGAVSFMDAYTTWTGGLETVPFGENENGMSDPSTLTEMYGWPIQLLIQRYNRLATLCLAALAIAYVCGVVISARTARDAKRTTIRVAE